MVTVTSIAEVKEALMYAKTEGFHPHLLGGGTNTYFGEKLSQFLFIQPVLKGREYIEEGNEVLLTIFASETWDEVVAEAVSKGLWGIENLSYIPGTVGAAPVQNIGAYGVELAEVLESVSVIDTENMEEKAFTKEMCTFGYRDSIFKYKQGKYIITKVALRLFKDPHPVLRYKPLDALILGGALTPQNVRDVVIHTRKAKLPDWIEHPNAGSFFKNPVVDIGTSQMLSVQYPEMPFIQVAEGYKIPAAWLIEHIAEMKGTKVGDVGTWPLQPLVIVNYGDALADDIDAMAHEIKERVYTKTGLILEQEVNRVG